MRRFLFVACVLVSGVVGYLLGRAGVGAGRAGSRGASAPERREQRFARVPLDEYVRMEERARRVAKLEAENARLKERLESLQPPDAEATEELPVGSRRPDGTIVGGARFKPAFERLATGFLESILENFLKEAKLSAEQERRLRERIRDESPKFTGIIADFVNADIDANTMYDRLAVLTEEGRQFVRGLVDDRQYEVYRRFEGAVKDIMHHQIVHNELTVLKSDLRLDPEQARKVEALVHERYRRVGERVTVAVPNVLLKPIRAERDEDIYTDTANRIRELLRPDQAAAFDAFEREAPEAPFDYRDMLVPK